MQGLMAALLILLAALFMIRHIRRMTTGKGSCACGCGRGSSSGGAHDDGRRVSVPGLSCSGACGGCQADKVES